jgi:hypothetical protein
MSLESNNIADKLKLFQTANSEWTHVQRRNKSRSTVENDLIPNEIESVERESGNSRLLEGLRTLQTNTMRRSQPDNTNSRNQNGRNFDVLYKLNSNFDKRKEDHETMKQYMYHRPREVLEKKKELDEDVDLTDKGMFPVLGDKEVGKIINVETNVSTVWGANNLNKMIHSTDTFMPVKRCVKKESNFNKTTHTNEISIMTDKTPLFADLLANKPLDHAEIECDTGPLFDEEGFEIVKKPKSKQKKNVY